jgi:hypothetical protein
MVADWWLQSHPNVNTTGGAPWLVGFYSRLKDEDLHPFDREYLEELLEWHKKKGDVEASG